VLPAENIFWPVSVSIGRGSSGYDNYFMGPFMEKVGKH
jgi:hypothetical protein